MRELRNQRLLTQKELADYLDLSQNRISQIEAGEGSFSAEHLLLLAKKFNVPPSSFVDDDTLPSEKLDDIIQLVREVLNAPQDSRSVAALAPVIVQHSDPQVLNRIRLRLVDWDKGPHLVVVTESGQILKKIKIVVIK